MLSIQTVTAAKKSSILAALFLLCGVISGCANKEQAAYKLAGQAQQQLDRGDLAGARLSIDEAIRERDDLVELHLLKGRIELAGKSLDAAFLSFYNAMALDPVNQTALQSVAMLGLQTGRADQAEEAAGKLLSLAPQNPTGLLVRGLIAVERRRYPDAIAAADAILGNLPTDEGAVVLKARTLYLSGAKDEARKVIRQAVELAGGSSGLARISLEMARADGDSAAMIAAFAQLRQQGQADPEAISDEANLRYKTGDTQAARDMVIAALPDEKLPPEARLRLLDLWREYDPGAPARGTLPQPRNRTVREGLAGYLLERNRHAEAEALLTGLDSPNASGLRARVLLAQGRGPEARQLADRVIATDATQCDARITLANLALASGNATAAVTSGQQAAAECPSLTAGWLVTAAAYTKAGQAKQAERVFRDGIAADPDDLALHKAFIAWLNQAGRGRETTGVARHLLRYAPNRITTWQLLAATCQDPACQGDAAAGLARAQRSFFIDRRPGELPRRGLFAALGRSSAGSAP